MNDPDAAKKAACETGGSGGAFFQFLGAPTAGKDKQGTEVPWQSIASFGSGRENALEVNGKTKTTGLTVGDATHGNGLTLYDTSGIPYCIDIRSGALHLEQRVCA